MVIDLGGRHLLLTDAAFFIVCFLISIQILYPIIYYHLFNHFFKIVRINS